MADQRADRALRELVAHLAAAPGAPPRVLSPVEDLPLELLRRHRLAPLAYRAGYESLRGDFIESALLAEIRAPLVAEVTGALAAVRIRVCLLKGTSYLGTIYDDPGERPMGDIDLMVPPAEHGRAVAVLEVLGYARQARRAEQAHTHHAVTLRRGPSTIDLHRSMIQPLRSRIDVDALWARALPATERDDGACRLHPIDEAALHLVHAARHELMVPLVAYVDAARLLRRPGVEPAVVLERAREFRLGRAVAAAAAMTAALERAADQVTWPEPGLGLLPGPTEVVDAEPVTRMVQLVRKAVLTEGPKELAGLAAVALWERFRPADF